MRQGYIFLVRHGQIPQSMPRCFVGQRDLPLDEVGCRQAEALGRWLTEISLSRVVSSDLCRARDTVQIAVGNRGLVREEDPRLREINLGQWEGLTKEEVRTRHPATFDRRGVDLAATRPEGGESFQDLLSRVVPAFEDVAGNGSGNVLIVTHAGVIRVLLCKLLGMPLNNLFLLEQDYGCVNIVAPQASCRLKCFNLIPEGRIV